METDLRVRVTGRELHPVHENLFGQFLEKPSWGNETGSEAALLPGTHRIDPRVEGMMQAMEIPVVRFPGGTDVDYVDWRDMVTDANGPGSGRPNSHARHQDPIVTNAFGYDEYGQLAERLGWKTILAVNLRDGLLGDKPPAAAAEHAAALLAYYAGEAATLPEAFRHWPALRAANGHPAPYTLEYVQIGNESWFWTEELKKKYGENWITASADCIERFIAAIRRVVPNAQIIADAQPMEIAAELSRRNAPVDLYAIHRYYPTGVGALYTPGGDTLPLENVSARQIWDTLVHSTQTDEVGLAVWQGRAIDQARRLGYKLAATEWNLNGWWRIGERRELWPGLGGCGMGAAVMLQGMMRAGDVIVLGNQSMLVGKSWGITGIRVAPDGVADPVYHPTAEVTTLYRRHHGDRRLQVDYETPAPLWNGEVFFGWRVTERAAIVDLLATRDDRNLYLHILNTDYDQPHRITVRLEDLPVANGPATLHRLRFLTPNEVQPGGAWTLPETDAVPVTSAGLALSVPCRSATIVVIPLVHYDKTGQLMPERANDIEAEEWEDISEKVRAPAI